jgi:hypothetical protein
MAGDLVSVKRRGYQDVKQLDFGGVHTRFLQAVREQDQADRRIASPLA